MDSIFRREIFFFQELPPFRLVYVTQPLRLRQQPPLFGQIRCYLLFSSSSLQQQCSKQCSRGDAQIRSFRVSELWLTSFFHKRWAGHLSIYFLRCLTEFFQRLEKKRSLPCGFPQPRKSSNSEVNRITIKFLWCNYHEREIAGETISSILCIKSLILFLKSKIPLPLFLLLSPLVSSNLNNSQSSHVSRRPRECRRQIWQIGFEIEQVPFSPSIPDQVRNIFEYAAFFPDQWNRRDYLGLHRRLFPFKGGEK